MSWPGPQRRERAVEREPDVGVLADALDRGRCRRRDRAPAWSEPCDGGRQRSPSPTSQRRRCRASASKRRERRRRHARPALPRTSGRSSATAAVRAGDRPVSAPGSPARRGRVGAARLGQALADDRRARLRRAPAGTRTTAANRKNARPSVRKTSPIDATFWMIGNGIGMTSASGPRWSRKLASSARRQDVVERRRDVGRGQAGGREARLPDRHVAAVDQDHDRVRQDADEGEAHARVAAVRPTARRAGARTTPARSGSAQRLDERRRPASSRTSVAEPDEDARRPAAPVRRRRIVGEVDELPPASRPRTSPSDDAADQHGRVPLVITAASCVDAATCRVVASGSTDRSRWRRAMALEARRPARRSRAARMPVGERPVSAQTRSAGVAAWLRAGGGHPVGGLGDERDRARLAGRPGSGTPSTWRVRTKASTTTGSNWMPANLRSSASACSAVSGVIR